MAYWLPLSKVCMDENRFMPWNEQYLFMFTYLAGHILDALRRNNETGVINSEFCIRL